jgi:group I intron endonuclease
MYLHQIYSIYKITNLISNKVYIGFAVDPDKRWYTHQKNSIYNKRNTHLYNAIQKYGIDNFRFDVIYQSIDYLHTHKTMETYFITEYRSYIGFLDCNGYNMTLGSEGSLGRIDSPETTKKRSLSKLGKKRPPMSYEQKMKISKANTGKKWSDEQRAKPANRDPNKNPMKNPVFIQKMLESRKKNKGLPK